MNATKINTHICKAHKLTLQDFPFTKLNLLMKSKYYGLWSTLSHASKDKGGQDIQTKANNGFYLLGSFTDMISG